jgi:hypothetical protein
MPAESQSKSLPSRLALGLGLLLAVGLLIVMRFALGQVDATRHLRPDKNNITEHDWRTPPVIHFDTDRQGGVWHTRLRIPGKSAGDPAPAQFEFDIPPDGVSYAMNLAVVKSTPPGPVHLDVSANGRLLGSLQPEPLRPRRNEISATERLTLPPAADRPATVTVRNQGPSWRGKLLLVPNPHWLRRILASLAGIGLLLLLVSTRWGRRLSRIATPALVFCVFLSLFYYTLFTNKMAPMNGVIMSDSDELIRVLVKKKWNEDAIKHILFAPTMQWLLGYTGEDAVRPDLRDCARVFSVVAALNCLVAYLLFLRLARRRTAAILLTCAYGFSFSIWVYSSVYETYIFSSLVLNLFLLAVLFIRPHSPLVAYLPATLLLALCGLAHLPLLVFLGLLWMRLWQADRTLVQRLLGCALLAALAGLVFLDGRLWIKQYYAGIHEALDYSWRAEFLTARETTITEFAGRDNLTFGNLGTLLLGQFLFVHGGLPQGHLWDLGWRGAAPILNHPVGLLLCLACATLWITAALGVARSPALRGHAFMFCALVLVPYLGFLWYFNPAEMLLYSAPLVSVSLLAFFTAGQQVLGRRIDYVLIVLVIGQIVWNVPVLLSYQ